MEVKSSPIAQVAERRPPLIEQSDCSQAQKWGLSDITSDCDHIQPAADASKIPNDKKDIRAVRKREKIEIFRIGKNYLIYSSIFFQKKQFSEKFF